MFSEVYEQLEIVDLKIIKIKSNLIKINLIEIDDKLHNRYDIDIDDYLIPGTGISGYKYVTYEKGNKWKIIPRGFNGRMIKKIDGGGCFNTPKEAAIAYKLYCNINNIEYN